MISLDVSAEDLVALLEVAQIQMDCVTADEAEAYGMSLDETARLHGVSSALLEALLAAQ